MLLTDRSPLGIVCLCLVFAVMGCPRDGGHAPDCPEDTPYFCSDEACHACCADDHCADHEECAEDYTCALDCEQLGEACSKVDDCCPGLACDWIVGECVPACADDQACQAETDPPDRTLVCRHGLCVHAPCLFPQDCPGAQVCFDGGCQNSPGCAQVDSCLITQEVVRVAPGQSARLRALALMADGRVAPGFAFDWVSDDPQVASVEAGQVQGGQDAGLVTIRAGVRGCQVDCVAAAHNPGFVPPGLMRVMVYEAESGRPVAGVTLSLDGVVVAATDENGTAEFDAGLPPGQAFELTASSADHHYLTIRGASGDDVRLALDRLEPPSAAAGFQGELQRVAAPCRVRGDPCEAHLGLVGSSLPERLHRLEARSLLGGRIRTEILLGGRQRTALLPCGAVLGINETYFKQRYQPVGVPGPRLTWSVHQSTNLSDYIETLGPILSDGDIDSAAFFMHLFRAAVAIYVDLGPVVSLSPRPMTADTGDLDFDGQTDDLVPDYADFPEIDLTALTPTRQRLEVNIPTMPAGVYDGVVVIAAARIKGIGLIPLGLGTGLDDAGEEAGVLDGIIEDPVVVDLVPVGDRLPAKAIDQFILALAFNLESYSSDRVTKRLAGQVLPVERLAGGTITLRPFMAQAEVTWDPSAWRLETRQVPAGAEILQAFFSDGQGRGWFVMGAAEDGTYRLPLAPPEGDRGQGAALLAIQPVPGVDWADLASGLAPLDAPLDWVQAFSFTEAGIQ